MHVDGSDVSGALAAFLAASRWEDVPEAVRLEAKRSILNGFATALAGCRDAATEGATKTLAAFAGPAEASLIGRPERFDILTAAFLNAVATNVFDFDDTHPRTIIHPTAPVSPALFAMAERQKITGAQLLHAFILGVETECRIGNAVSPGHYKRGWHITASCGVFGAAAGAAKLLDLDARQTVWALGNASAQASGLVETLGSMAKSIGVGNAARGGMLAAFLARNGVAGPDHPIEGERGFVAVTSDAPDLKAILDRLGTSWEILDNTYKLYPCGVVLNPVIEACLDLRAGQDFSAETVQRVSVSGHSLLRERTDRPSVERGREAQVSAQHAVAVSLIRGTAGLSDFSDAAVQDAQVRALRETVHVVVDPEIPVGAARVVVTCSDGREIENFIGQARGDPGRPLSDADLETKFRDLAAYGCPALDPAPLIDAIWSLDRSEDAGSVMAMARA